MAKWARRDILNDSTRNEQLPTGPAALRGLAVQPRWRYPGVLLLLMMTIWCKHHQ